MAGYPEGFRFLAFALPYERWWERINTEDYSNAHFPMAESFICGKCRLY